MRNPARCAAALFVLTGCATQAPSPAMQPVHRDPSARRAEREVARLSAERDEIRRAEAERLLASLPATTDETARRRAVVQALRLDASWALDRDPSDVAAIAPDVLRVYDLSAVLDDGLDDGEIVLSGAADRVFDGGEMLLQRIAGSVRRALPETAWPAGMTTMEVAGECLLVVQTHEAFDAVDAALDRFATVGGGCLRVTATSTRGDDVRTLALDVPFGRVREAWDGTQTSYVKDFDVDAGSRVGDPVIDTLRDGVTLTALYGPAAGGARTLALDVTACEAKRPFQEFTTPLGNWANVPVRLQIPEVRVQRFHDDVTIGAQPQSFSHAPGDWTVEVRVAGDDGANAARPGWRRVAATSVPRVAGEEPLVDNAVALAGAQAANTDRDDPRATLRSAVLGARAPSWVRRVRIGSGATNVALVRHPVRRAQGDVLAAVRAADVALPQQYGFLAVEDGTLVACVAPESVGALWRALGAVERTGPSTMSVAEVSCPACEQVSYVADFDLDASEDAVVADPVVSIVQNGAAITVRPVASEPGLYDLRVTHTFLERPIDVFTTSLGVGSDVSIQLPRTRQRVETTRVRLAPGASVATTSSLQTAAGTDVRSFVLTRK